jgi:hypothetical protein
MTFSSRDPRRQTPECPDTATLAGWDRRVRLLVHARIRGYGDAVRSGIAAAQMRGARVRVVGAGGGDAQHDRNTIVHNAQRWLATLPRMQPSTGRRDE